MTRRSLALLSLAVLCAGCGSTAAATRPTTPAAVPAAAQSLSGAEATAQATWAVLPMGARSGPNLFWQLLLDDGGTWRLETPPDIATNGAIALAGLSGDALVTGVRPSLYLSFSPVSSSANGGRTWTAGPPASGLASVPDALAATAAGGLLALSTKGQVSQAAADGASWRDVATAPSLAASAPARRCGPESITAVAYTPAGAPMVGTSCSRPGTAGLFTAVGRQWRAANLAVPAALGGARISVLRLVSAGPTTTALLQAGTGPRAALVAAWLSADGRWTVSAPLTTGSTTLLSSSFGADGSAAVVLAGRRAEIISPEAGGSWRALPPLPNASNVVVALPAGQPVTALAADAGTVRVWRMNSDGSAWLGGPTIKVPIQYGSSA